MDLFCRGLPGGTRNVRISPNGTVKDVITSLKVMASLGPKQTLRLSCECIQLDENQPVSMLQLPELDVTVSLPGGKVHGSLARAGKVRSQTPKVEKADRHRKKVVGRAKRRAQYHRRFVSCIRDPRRASPNSKK